MEMRTGKVIPPAKSAAKIALIYLALGIAWIFLSDRALEIIIKDPDLLFRMQTAKGWLFVLFTGLVLFWVSTRFISSYSIAAEEARMAAEEAARTRDMARTYLDIVEVVIVALDRDGRVSMINRKGAAVLGFDNEEDVIGLDWFENFVPEKERKQVREVFESLMSGDREPVDEFENRLVCRGGEERAFEWRNSVVRDSTGNITGTLSSGLDITERKNLQERLSRTQKMEALGRMAGSVAHDFNNVLAGITGYGSMIKEKLKKDPVLLGRSPDLLVEVEELMTATDKGAGITGQLLAFSRQDRAGREKLCVNDVLSGMEGMIKRLMGKRVSLVTELGDVPLVEADRTQLEQVFLNLALNARDAISENGRVTISTSVCVPPEVENGEFSFSGGSYVKVSFRDDGDGMDQETRARIFEPFFTTKPAEKGTGLGLATVYGIIKRNHGNIRVESGPGKGAAFHIYLPAVSGETAARQN